MNNISAIEWACQYLKDLGYKLTEERPKTIKYSPWSFLARFSTSQGYIFLKQVPKPLALEAPIIQILREEFNAQVSTIIAQSTEHNCFLMKDAGQPLREILKKKFDEELLSSAIDQFTVLQLEVAKKVNVFLDVGVPDWRLEQFPVLFNELIEQRDLLVADGLSLSEVSTLAAMIPKISALCEKLSYFPIQRSIVQPDFNDNNILVESQTQSITHIDLGEVVISHPFFSLLNCLHQLMKHFGLNDMDGMYLRIKSVCYKNYKFLFKSEQELNDTIALTHKLWKVYGALSQYRLIKACGAKHILSFQPGKLKNVLREISACIS